MKKKNNNSSNLLYAIILFFLISILITDNDIFKKTYKIINNENYTKRIENNYGFCEKSSIGYLRYIKKRYDLNFNPKIINFKKNAPLDWSIYNLKFDKDDKKIILLNYNRNLDLIFTKHKKNSWLYKESINKIKTIKEIKFHTINSDPIYIEGKINLYKVNTRNKKKLIYTWKINQNISSKSIYTNYQSNDLHTLHEKLIVELDVFDNKHLDDIISITLTGNNIVDIEKFNIINQIKDCYYVSTRS